MRRANLIALMLSLTTAQAHADLQILNTLEGDINAILAEMRERIAELGPLCQTTARSPMYDYDTAPVQESMARVVANAFAPDGSSENLSFFVHIPTHLVPSCPDGAVEPFSYITLLPDGSFQGVVESTNMSFNGHLFMAQISFTTQDIVDWEFYTRATDTQPYALYGAFSLRNLPPRSDGTPSPRYAPDILPPDWN